MDISPGSCIEYRWMLPDPTAALISSPSHPRSPNTAPRPHSPPFQSLPSLPHPHPLAKTLAAAAPAPWPASTSASTARSSSPHTSPPSSHPASFLSFSPSSSTPHTRARTTSSDAPLPPARARPTSLPRPCSLLHLDWPAQREEKPEVLDSAVAAPNPRRPDPAAVAAKPTTSIRWTRPRHGLVRTQLCLFSLPSPPAILSRRPPAAPISPPPRRSRRHEEVQGGGSGGKAAAPRGAERPRPPLQARPVPRPRRVLGQGPATGRGALDPAGGGARLRPALGRPPRRHLLDRPVSPSLPPSLPHLPVSLSLRTYYRLDRASWYSSDSGSLSTESRISPIVWYSTCDLRMNGFVDEASDIR